MMLSDYNEPVGAQQCFGHFSQNYFDSGYFADSITAELHINVCPFVAVINLKTAEVVGMDAGVYLEADDIIELVIGANQ